MKNNIKEFFEDAGICAVSILFVFSLNSKFAQKTNSTTVEPANKTDQFKTDTIKSKAITFAISQKSKTR